MIILQVPFRCINFSFTAVFITILSTNASTWFVARIQPSFLSNDVSDTSEVRSEMGTVRRTYLTI